HSRPCLSITGCRQVIPHRHSLITEYHQWGKSDLCINNSVNFFPASSCTLLCMAVHSTASVKHAHSTQ
ncbi:unnamed protein product, partial [Staurois parvus]